MTKGHQVASRIAKNTPSDGKTIELEKPFFQIQKNSTVAIIMPFIDGIKYSDEVEVIAGERKVALYV